MISLLGSLIALETALDVFPGGQLGGESDWDDVSCSLFLMYSLGSPTFPGPVLHLPLKITGLALHIFNKLSGTDTGSPEATTGKVTEAGPTKPTWGVQVTPALSRDTPRA